MNKGFKLAEEDIKILEEVNGYKLWNCIEFLCNNMLAVKEQCDYPEQITDIFQLLHGVKNVETAYKKYCEGYSPTGMNARQIRTYLSYIEDSDDYKTGCVSKYIKDGTLIKLLLRLDDQLIKLYKERNLDPETRKENPYDEDGHRIFWFDEDAEGKQIVVYKNGNIRAEDIKKYDAEMTEEAYKGLQRTRLYMTEVGEWDGSAFAAAMDATFAYGPFTDNQGETYAITLSTPMAAEERIYPLLTDEQIAKSKEYVKEFYSNSQNQIGRDLGILYPVCLKVYVDHRKEPYDVREIEEIFRVQSGEVMNFIDDESIDIMFENLNREDDYAPCLDERGYPIYEATIMPADYGQEAFFIKDAESGEVFRVYKIESGFSSVFEMRRIDYYISHSDLKRFRKSKCFDGDDFIMEYMDEQDRLGDMLDIVTSGGIYTIE